jgi:hypothetical protein
VGTRQMAVVLDDGGAFLEGFAIVGTEVFAISITMASLGMWDGSA